MEHFDLYLIKTQGSHRRHHDPYKQGEVFHQFTLTLVADNRVETTDLRSSKS